MTTVIWVNLRCIAMPKLAGFTKKPRETGVTGGASSVLFGETNRVGEGSPRPLTITCCMEFD